MRNELNNIEHIEKYLRDELSPADKKAFEDKLKTDSNLQKEVELQKDVIRGIERVGAKQSIQKSYKKYKLGKSVFNLGLGTIIIATLVTAFLWYSDSNKANANVLPQFNENGEEIWADADKYLESQRFTVNTSKDTVIETEGGIVMYIPTGSFLDENGNEVKGEVEFEVKEALNTAQILQGGLSSKSGDRLLESAGMFYVNARKDGKTVKINPDKGIYTEVPADDVNPDMQLFDGKRMADGSIDWIDPKPLDKLLTPVDINSLNFYPPKYEPKLAELGYDLSDKKFKDSLYYSFAYDEKPSLKKSDCFTYVSSNIGDAIVNSFRVGDGFVKAYDNITWVLNVDKISCDEFNVQLELKTTDSISINHLHFENKTGNHYRDSIKGSPTFELYGHLIKKEIGDVINISQTIKINKKGIASVVLKLTSIYDMRLSDKNEFMSFEIDFQNIELSTDACSGPYISYSSIEAKADTTGISSLEFGIKSPYLFAQDTEVIYEEEAVATHQVCGINPAKIKAIWSKQFNNTLLATREFEERLKTIFGTCNDAVLDLYVNNMNLNLYEIDEMAASMTSGEIKKKFLEFASRKDGKVKIDDKRIKKLQKHYERKQKMIAEAVAKTKRKFDKENRKLDAKAGEERTNHTQAEFDRWQDNFNKEYDINLTEAYRQLGKKRPAPQPLTPGYRVTIRRAGWKNVDQYVFASTNNRKSLNYTDPETGKKAVIKYENISVTINDEGK
jgi:hypothetical protein